MLSVLTVACAWVVGVTPLHISSLRQRGSTKRRFHYFKGSVVWIGDSQLSQFEMPYSCKSELKTREHWLGAEEPGDPGRSTNRAHKTPRAQLWFTRETLRMKARLMFSVKCALQEFLGTPDANKRYYLLEWAIERKIPRAFHATSWISKHCRKAWKKLHVWLRTCMWIDWKEAESVFVSYLFRRREKSTRKQNT